jgi:NAD(P)-dependent dehydrogenase (short-subunit alcohol dehydrogenase family)
MSPSSSASEPSGSPPRGGVDLTGQVAIVTGGTRGAGLGIARRLHGAGAQVLVCGRSAPAAALPFAFVRADVREPDQAAGVVEEAVRRFDRLDLAVNNAGGGPSVPADDVKPNLATSIVRLNLLAPFFVAQAAAAAMRATGGGQIINISSVSATRPAPGTAVYAAAKAGLNTLTQALALEWAPAVRVNAITVGVLRTEDNEHHYGDEAALAAVAATVPLGRMATPEDVADACLLLASPLAGYVTGANLVLDGGGQIPAFATALAASRSA